MTTSFNPLTAWWETLAATNNALLTINMRSLHLAREAGSSTIVPSDETIRMVSEKVSALSEGMVAATSLWLDMMRSPMDISYEAGPQLAMAFVTPGFRKANANAKRLSRRPAS